MNLVKELRKIAQLNAENALNQANAILDTDKDKDLEMLQYFGRNAELDNAKDMHKISSEIMQAGNRVTMNDVQKVCFKYALRFSFAFNYKKPLPMHVLNDLRNFKEKLTSKGCKFNPAQLKVIAPVSHFHTVDAPKKDPVLVYEHQYFNIEIISTWGNDFSMFRMLRGLWWSYWQYIVSAFIITIPFFVFNDMVIIGLIAFINALISFVLILSSFIGYPNGEDFPNPARLWDTNHK